MNKLRQYHRSVFLLPLAVVCAESLACAQQQYVSGPRDLPIVAQRKQASALIVAKFAPEYPPIAKVNYLEGQVQLQLTVNSKGKVTSAHVLKGIAILADSALKAARKWVYRPLATPSGPSGFMTTVKMRFNLTNWGTGLTPRRAEHDFQRQVKSAQIIRSLDAAPAGHLVHTRLLVSAQGKVIDVGVTPDEAAHFDAVRRTLQDWSFRPAHWGNLPIASYLDVDVPVGTPPLTRQAANTVTP